MKEKTLKSNVRDGRKPVTCLSQVTAQVILRKDKQI